MTFTANDLLRVAREAQRDLDAAGGHDIQIPRIGMFGLATVQAFREAATPARIVELIELLRRETTNADASIGDDGNSERVMTTDLDREAAAAVAPRGQGEV